MIYFDSAATTFQKPAAVPAAMMRALDTMTSPGRGNHPTARAAADTAFRCRTALAELFHVPSPEQVVFTSNATHALNIAIKTLVPAGGTAVISNYEHNAVTRPLYALGTKTLVADAPLFRPGLTLQAFERAITEETDAVICTQTSNVFGTVLPIGELAEICRRRDVPLIVDASQSAGVLPIDFKGWGAAFVAMPGHKGLYGPQGTGVLLCSGEAKTLLEGGTGSQSLEQSMPEFLPDRLEAGTHNMPGIAGLLEGVRFVCAQGEARILNHEQDLAQQLCNGLRKLTGIHVFARDELEHQTGVVSFTADGWDTEDLGEALAEQNIAVRAGLHCAPLAHHTTGTMPGGTVRVSFSAFNTAEEVEIFLAVLRQILQCGSGC